MFKFILLTLLFVAATTMVANAESYDDTAHILEMAFDAVEEGTAATAATAVDDGEEYADEENDLTEDNTGYIYNDGDLEDNINIAINAAILDKYGQAVTSERSAYEQGDKDVETVEHIAPLEEDENNGNEVDNTDYEAAKSENVAEVKESANLERSSKSVGFQSSSASSQTAEKSESAKTVTPVKNVQYDDSDTITRFVSQVNADGTYGFDFAQSSGLEFKEVGQGGLYAQGSYQYVSPEGEHISVTYRADENGFHPESDILPTPPPIPSYILKALEYIREHPSAEEQANREIRAQQQV